MGLYTESHCQPPNAQNGRIPPPPFKATDVGPIHSGQVGKRFLRQAPSKSHRAQSLSEEPPWIFARSRPDLLRSRHGVTIGRRRSSNHGS